MVIGAVCLWHVLVVLSPFGLMVLDHLDRQEWDLLSAIGQTYGAVSALLAAMALCGVVVSIVQQQRSAQVDREHVYRAVHIELSRMLLDHPDLMESYTSLGRSPPEKRLYVYCNQQVRALQMGFEIGALDEHYLAGSARELFGSLSSHRWWELVRHNWRTEARSARQRRMVEIFDREWHRATPVDRGSATGERADDDHETGAAADRPTPVVPRERAATAATRSHRRVVAAVAGIGMVLTLARARRTRAA